MPRDKPVASGKSAHVERFSETASLADPIYRRDRTAPLPHALAERMGSGQKEGAPIILAEVVTQFFPLREGEDLTALESLQLVRVELPGSALGEVGLPVDPETANEPVKADVVLGQDGLARAGRFVR